MVSSRTENKAIIVYYDGSFVALANGSHMRLNDLLRHLSTMFADITLYSFRDHPDEPWTEDYIARFDERFPGISLALDSRSPVSRLVTRIKNALIPLVPGLAAPLIRFALPGLAPAYTELRKQKPDAVFLVNYVDALTQLNGVPLERTAIETHDLKFVNFLKRFGGSPTRLRAVLKYRSEVAMLNLPKILIAITEAEANFYRMVLNRPKIFHVPLYAPPQALAEPAEQRGAHDVDYDLLFAASDNTFNVQGFADMMRTHASWLSHYRIALCGRICTVQSVKDIANRHPNITLLGFVDDLESVFAKTKASLSPTDGTGLKIKVVESLKHATPAFVSQHTLDGLVPGYNGCIFLLNEENVAAILSHADRLEAAQRAAGHYFQVFGNSGDLAALDNALAELAEQTHAPGVSG